MATDTKQTRWERAHQMVQVKLLVPKAERSAFQRACAEQEQSMREVLRRFMRSYSERKR